MSKGYTFDFFCLLSYMYMPSLNIKAYYTI